MRAKISVRIYVSLSVLHSMPGASFMMDKMSAALPAEKPSRAAVPPPSRSLGFP